jgi:cyclopropane-fatty-acyl-phospholipid synthase
MSETTDALVADRPEITIAEGLATATPRSAWGAKVDKACFALARRLSTRATLGTINVVGPAGGFVVGSGGPEVTVTVHDPRAYSEIFLHSSIGLAEGYIAGHWETDDLVTLLRLVSGNLAGGLETMDRIVDAAAGPLSALHRLKPPTPHKDRRNVRAHYDLPGELYDAMLDGTTMMYSCGVFATPATSLADAQVAKLEMICDKLDLGPDDHLLEIGTGWGGLAIHAAATRGCRVTTTTLSVEQRKLATQRVAEAGLSDRIEILGLDYRALTGTYDKLVSIEMIEAVDWRLYETFFATCERLLAPDGLMLLQAITITDGSFERAKLREDFIRALIFPGGCLPSLKALAAAMAKAGHLQIVGMEDIGEHYATTLAAWRANFEAHWDTVKPAGYGEEFARLWELYLCYCEAAFLDRHISDIQLVIGGPRYKRGALPVPLAG